MKKIKHILSLIIILALTISLTSCLSFVRDIKIYKDGSGEETLTIEFGRDFMMMLVALVSAADSTREKNYTDSLYNDELFIQDTKAKYENMPGVNLIDITSKTNEDSSKTMTVTYLFDEAFFCIAKTHLCKLLHLQRSVSASCCFHIIKNNSCVSTAIIFYKDCFWKRFFQCLVLFFGNVNV